jgi:hypothetical protein
MGPVFGGLAADLGSLADELRKSSPLLSRFVADMGESGEAAADYAALIRSHRSRRRYAAAPMFVAFRAPERDQETAVPARLHLTS